MEATRQTRQQGGAHRTCAGEAHLQPPRNEVDEGLKVFPAAVTRGEEKELERGLTMCPSAAGTPCRPCWLISHLKPRCRQPPCQTRRAPPEAPSVQILRQAVGGEQHPGAALQDGAKQLVEDQGIRHVGHCSRRGGR